MSKEFKFSGLFIRILIAIVLVFATYNPSGYSYVDWVINRGDTSLPLLILAGIVLIICWVIFLRATLRSLGPLGISLALAFCGCLVWLAIDLNWINLESKLFVYIVLIIVAIVLGVGMSWSHVRRRMSGQSDIDDVDD